MDITCLAQNEFANSEGLRRAMAGGYHTIWNSGYMGLPRDTIGHHEFHALPRVVGDSKSSLPDSWKSNEPHRLGQFSNLALPSQATPLKIESSQPRQGAVLYALSPTQEPSPVQQEWASFQALPLQKSFTQGFSSPTGVSHPPIKIEDDSDSMSTLSSAYPTVEDFLPSSFPNSEPPLHLQRRRSIPSVLQYHHPRPGAGPISPALNKGRRDRRTRPSIPDHLDVSEAFFHRSNYENIMDGSATDIYPDEFAAKILSKKIAHKISEKTRRTRLTAAIREIEKLLPPPQEPRSEESTRPGESSHEPQNNPISKVDVVESAVGFVKKLKEDTVDAIRRAEEAERRSEQAERHTEELERRIEETERRAVEAEQLLKMLRDGRQSNGDGQW